MSEPHALPELPPPTAGKRRRFTAEHKLLLLDRAALPGESVSSVARRYGLSVSLMFRWRRALRGPLPRPSRPGDRTSELAQLRAQVARLQELLGRTLVELEELRSRERDEHAPRAPSPNPHAAPT